MKIGAFEIFSLYSRSQQEITEGGWADMYYANGWVSFRESTSIILQVWNRRTNTAWAALTLAGHSGTVRCLHLHGNRLVSGSSDRTIKVNFSVQYY